MFVAVMFLKAKAQTPYPKAFGKKLILVITDCESS
jgi:hypothetical protein